MEIYLPIAEISVNIWGILALGVVTGILSGMFGVGGGFLTTPFLMFIGISPAVAVASSANQIVASSLSGFFAHHKRGNVDFAIGFLLLVGGIIGSGCGVWVFARLKQLGQIDLVISILYVTMLGSIGLMMARESLRALQGKSEHHAVASVVSRFAILARLPMMREFPRSKLKISAILPFAIGFFSGILVSLLGVGGGFFMIPAMIYILGMPTSIVIGTSLYQIIFITANVTLLQALTTQTVDIVLAVLLIAGSVVGVKIGSELGMRLPAAKLRAMLAAILLLVALKLAFGLFATPDNIYSITVI